LLPGKSLLKGSGHVEHDFTSHQIDIGLLPAQITPPVTLSIFNKILLRLFLEGSYGGLRYNQASLYVVHFPKEKNDG